MSSLRYQLVKLAYDKPELRPSLGPLLSKIALGIGVGSGFENEKSLLRIHRFASSIRVTDLTNAGKRGKKVDEFAVYDLDTAEKDAVDRLASQLASKVSNYREALSLAQSWVEYYDDIKKYPHPKIEQGHLRGVDVTPAGFKPVKIKGSAVFVEADFNGFTVKDLEDKNNESTCIAQGKKSVKLFYRWVSDNQAKLKTMKFREVVNAMMKEGIEFHQYCAMD